MDSLNCLFFICAGIGNIGEVGRWVARSKARDKTARQTECGKTLRLRVCARVCARMRDSKYMGGRKVDKSGHKRNVSRGQGQEKTSCGNAC